jgi:hypothetical protein
MTDLDSVVFSYFRHGRHAEAKQALSSGRHHIEDTDHFGNTTLAVACQNGLKKMAKLCLRFDANINCRNSTGNTPLHFCYLFGYGDGLGTYLEEKGANADAVNLVGLTPPMMAGYTPAQIKKMEDAAPPVEVTDWDTFEYVAPPNKPMEEFSMDDLIDEEPEPEPEPRRRPLPAGPRVPARPRPPPPRRPPPPMPKQPPPPPDGGAGGGEALKGATDAMAGRILQLKQEQQERQKAEKAAKRRSLAQREEAAEAEAAERQRAEAAREEAALEAERGRQKRVEEKRLAAAERAARLADERLAAEREQRRQEAVAAQVRDPERNPVGD